MTEPGSTNPPPARTMESILEILRMPVPREDIKFLARTAKEGKCLGIPYVDGAFVAARLDDACGPWGWQTQIIGAGGRAALGVLIQNPKTGEWHSRWDVGEPNPKDPNTSKKEVTDAFKRASKQWGVARELNDIPKRYLPAKTFKQGDKWKFSHWTGNPWPIIDSHGGGGSGSGSGGNQGKKDPTPADARKHVFDLLVGDMIANTPQQANAWISDQERENGKTVEAYRNMYQLLKASNAPPDESEAVEEA